MKTELTEVFCPLKKFDPKWRMVKLKDVFLYDYINNWILRSKNGILLTFKWLPSFFFIFYDLWTFIWVSCAFSFLLKAAPTVAASGCSRSFLNQSLKTEDTPQVCLPHLPFTVPDMGLLLMGLKKHPSQYVPCPVKHLPFHSSKALTGFLIPTTSNLLFWLSMFFCSVNLHVFMCVCVCMLRVFWNSLDKKELSLRWTFLSTE